MGVKLAYVAQLSILRVTPSLMVSISLIAVRVDYESSFCPDPTTPPDTVASRLPVIIAEAIALAITWCKTYRQLRMRGSAALRLSMCLFQDGECLAVFLSRNSPTIRYRQHVFCVRSSSDSSEAPPSADASSQGPRTSQHPPTPDLSRTGTPRPHPRAPTFNFDTSPPDWQTLTPIVDFLETLVRHALSALKRSFE